jgi:hypothetical protein
VTDTLNRGAGQVDYFGTIRGGDTTVGVVVGAAMIDYSKVERLLIGGTWIEIKPGSLSHETFGHPGGPRLFWTWTTPKGDTAAAMVAEIGFSPLVGKERATPRQAPVLPPRIECVSESCPNLVSRQGQHCATCCEPNCECDVSGPFVTPEERHEALFLADEYERASIRERPNTPMFFNFRRKAEEQRKIAARPIREAEPVVEPEAEPDAD